MAVDPKWAVPKDHDLVERELALPPPRGYTGTAPVLGLLSVRALEEHALGEDVLALVAWQALAGEVRYTPPILERIATTIEIGGLELLMVGHAYVATGAADGAAFEAAQRARKILKQPVTAHSIDASLLLAVTALPFGRDRVKTLLGMLDPELQHGTDEHRAVHALLRAAADPEVSIDDAYARFVALDDNLGLAQCALLAYAREAATTRQVDPMHAYLEHAVYRYDADGRPEWAARTIVQALVPLLVDQVGATPEVVGDQLTRAATFAAQARSLVALDGVFHAATKLGYSASLSTLAAFDPPTFAKRTGAAPAAQPPAPATKVKKAPKKKKA